MIFFSFWRSRPSAAVASVQGWVGGESCSGPINLFLPSVFSKRRRRRNSPAGAAGGIGRPGGREFLKKIHAALGVPSMRWRRACLGAINCVSNFRDKNSKLCDSASPRLPPEIGVWGVPRWALILHRVSDAPPPGGIRWHELALAQELLLAWNMPWRDACSFCKQRDRNSILHANCNSCDRKASSVPAAIPIANLIPLK